MALFLVLCTTLYLLTSRTPAPPDTTAAFTTLTRVQFFAENYLTATLTGTGSDAPALAQMTANQSVPPPELNSAPLAIGDLNVSDITSHTADGVTEWVVTLGVTLTAPGSNQPQRNFYAVTVVEHGGALKALTNPRPVNNVRPALQIDSAYPETVSLASTLGSAMTSFVSAYFTAQSGSLGRFVSSSFRDQPIIESPYTTAELLSIHTIKTVDPAAKKGTTAHVLLTVKGSLSLTTFQTLDVPVTVRTVDTGQWVVDSLDTLTYYGAVH